MILAKGSGKSSWCSKMITTAVATIRRKSPVSSFMSVPTSPMASTDPAVASLRRPVHVSASKNRSACSSILLGIVEDYTDGGIPTQLPSVTKAGVAMTALQAGAISCFTAGLQFKANAFMQPLDAQTQIRETPASPSCSPTGRSWPTVATKAIPR
jgi:hypothetical protein